MYLNLGLNYFLLLVLVFTLAPFWSGRGKVKLLNVRCYLLPFPHLEGYWENKISSWMAPTLREVLHPFLWSGKVWSGCETLGVSLICFSRVQPSHLHMGGGARGSSCSPNQLSLRCGWREADVCFSFWCADHKHFFRCFLHLLMILPLFYIAFSLLFPICLLLQFINGRLHVLQVTWFHDVYICEMPGDSAQTALNFPLQSHSSFQRSHLPPWWPGAYLTPSQLLQKFSRLLTRWVAPCP